MPTKDHWSRLARFSLLLDLLEIREKLVVNVINSNQDMPTDIAIELWSKDKCSALNRINSVLDDLKNSGKVHIDKLYFANRQLRTLLT